MATICDVMSPCVVTIRPDATLAEAVKILCDDHLSGVPVVSESGEVLGFITESSLMDILFDVEARQAPVTEYMSRGLQAVAPEDDIATAATLFAMYGVRRLPVVGNGKLLGVVTRRDLLQHSLERSTPLSDPLRELIPAEDQYA